MALNFIAEKQEKINWKELHNKIYRTDLLIELVPMKGCGRNGGDAIGISIPRKNIGENTFQQLKDTILILQQKFRFEVFDMYSGNKIGTSNLEGLKGYFEED